MTSTKHGAKGRGSMPSEARTIDPKKVQSIDDQRSSASMRQMDKNAIGTKTQMTEKERTKIKTIMQGANFQQVRPRQLQRKGYGEDKGRNTTFTSLISENRKRDQGRELLRNSLASQTTFIPAHPLNLLGSRRRSRTLGYLSAVFGHKGHFESVRVFDVSATSLAQ